MKKIIVTLIVVGIIFALGVGLSFTGNFISASKYDEFAKCLSDKGVKMYGAYWCPHCNDQKEMFEGSWKYVNYIECALSNQGGQTQICKQAGIMAYPTWEFPDGTRIEGMISLEQLSRYSNCEISE